MELLAKYYQQVFETIDVSQFIYASYSKENRSQKNKTFWFWTSNFTCKTLFLGFLTRKYLDIAKQPFDWPFFYLFSLFLKCTEIACVADNLYYYTSDSLWKIWLVESIQSIHNSLWTWHDKCNMCCSVCLVTKPLGVFSSETEWLNASLLFLRMNYCL